MKIQENENQVKVLIIFTHPREDSLNCAIKNSFIRGVKKRTRQIRIKELYQENFDPLLYDIKKNNENIETQKMKDDIKWAERIVFITPIWWASVPAMLKGYFDRVFTEEFAFRYNQAGIPEGLLDNKKAFLLCTSDTPTIMLYMTGGMSGIKAIIRGVLKFCGIKDSKFKIFGSVIQSSLEKRKKWIGKAEVLGERIAKPENKFQTCIKTLKAYTIATRLPLYTFVFCAMLLGTSLSVSATGKFNLLLFVLALITGLFAHIAVSYSNEVSDEMIDKHNENRTMFNGGTGLLMKKMITRKGLHIGWICSALFALLIPLIMTLFFNYHWLLLLSLGLALFLGIEYSLPPLRFARFGMGEIAAFLAYGIPLILTAFAMQTNSFYTEWFIRNYRMYMLSLPVSLSAFAVLCLTQIPDTEADRKYGKRSISVLLTPSRVLLITAFSLLFCVVLFIIFMVLDILSFPYVILMSIMPILIAIKIFFNLDAHTKPASVAMLQIIGMSLTSAVLIAVLQAIYFFRNPIL